ncbi:phosphotransferase [Halocynthiibacter sp. C4]|uniref:phosphotransferase n=1 Tax=Halocynthiibacter sp. C4 TaxID=2992758 RepID=UPI00237AB784|nr:phosphotransferase [Halocynthiibacter sp. C4]MDE0589775.1 phosphotransferase [Halocynthiibacter sp. C4]
MSGKTASNRPDLSEFGQIEILRPLKGSTRSCVYLVTDGKKQLVAKSTAEPEASLEWLQEAKRHAEAVGFITPRSYRTRGGALAQDGWTLESFEFGTPYPTSSLPDLASSMREFRAATSNMPQRPGCLASCDYLYQDKGPDIDFSSLPDEIAAAARAAWENFCTNPLEVIHGDLGAGNILMTGSGRAVLIDWDEARRDIALFDEFPLLPFDRTTKNEQRAYYAWEAASGWDKEPEYARRMADLLLALS